MHGCLRKYREKKEQAKRNRSKKKERRRICQCFYRLLGIGILAKNKGEKRKGVYKRKEGGKDKRKEERNVLYTSILHTTKSLKNHRKKQHTPNSIPTNTHTKISPIRSANYLPEKIKSIDPFVQKNALALLSWCGRWLLRDCSDCAVPGVSSGHRRLAKIKGLPLFPAPSLILGTAVTGGKVPTEGKNEGKEKETHYSSRRAWRRLHIIIWGRGRVDRGPPRAPPPHSHSWLA